MSKHWKQVECKPTVKLKVYDFLSGEFESAVKYGLRRYYKHREPPKGVDIEAMGDEIADQAWNVFNEVFDFE